jgi:hypothetical protein
MVDEPQWNLFSGEIAAEYLRERTLLEQHMGSTLKFYDHELLGKVRRILNVGVLTRQSWTETARQIQKAFGDSGRPMGEKLGFYGSTGAAARAARLVVTELARARALGHHHYVKHDDDVIGIKVIARGRALPHTRSAPGGPVDTWAKRRLKSCGGSPGILGAGAMCNTFSMNWISTSCGMILRRKGD